MTNPHAAIARLRATPALRRLTRETRLDPARLVLPVFVAESPEHVGPIPAMPGVSRHDLDGLARIADQAANQQARDRIGGLILFGVPASKDPAGSAASDPEGVTARAIARLRQTLGPPNAAPLAVLADVCICQYTSHGHCGVFTDERPDHAATLERYAQAAVAYAQAGADVVAPSGMMDAQVAAIRAALDNASLRHAAVLAYAIKHASAFYGPFRDAASSAPAFGDRRAHQMDPANAREALREALADEAEGADALMVKPAMTNLDTLARLRDQTNLPLAAYHVSGEYASIKAAAANGWIDERAAVLESLTAIRRAGADLILTYFALDAARWLAQDP